MSNHDERCGRPSRQGAAPTTASRLLFEAAAVGDAVSAFELGQLLQLLVGLLEPAAFALGGTICLELGAQRARTRRPPGCATPEADVAASAAAQDRDRSRAFLAEARALAVNRTESPSRFQTPSLLQGR
jgi:hypothetical protein